jgi:hypothetical protein
MSQMLKICVIYFGDVDNAEQSHLHVLKLALNHLKITKKNQFHQGKCGGGEFLQLLTKGQRGVDKC